MSKVVDQRVVEMQFDNKQFEKNVASTMSTLEKLKSKLNFSGSAKGLDEVGRAAKNVNMSGLASGIETVNAKFSAMQVVGVTALANITNSAVNAGKRIASALTIDPIKTGLSEYETKMNAIQVIKANTRGKNDMNDINAALADLNDYADRTIYNFTQMTDNVGKFVAQGLDVYEAANAVKGLANLAGASGASAQDMARATYQMSQALGGVIRKMDWNSLRNANMASVELKNTLMEIAKVRGIDVEGMMKETDTGIFEDTLEKGWLTGELFTEAMNIYSDVYSEAELKAKGFTDAQIANFKDLAKTAKEATTEVKTVSQLWDVLKETAQSGWTQTWELIFGSFDDAKAMFTGLQVYFSNIINTFSNARNTFLGGIFNPLETWNGIKAKLEGAGLGKIKQVAEAVSNVTDKLTHFQEVVDKVWRGDYKNSDTGRFELLEKAGYDHRVVQDLVNKGYQYKLTMEDVEESHKKFGLTMDKTSESTKEVAESFGEISDAKLKDAGLTEAEIRLYRDLEEEARRSNRTIQQVVEDMDKMDGRTMMIESATNVWKQFEKILKAVGAAWVDAFPHPSVVKAYSVFQSIHEFLTGLNIGDETIDKLTRTFKGLFAIVDIATTLFGGGLKIAFKILTQLLGAFDLDILSVTANIGDAIVGFRNWMDSVLDFTAVFETIAPYIRDGIEAVKEWVNKVKGSEAVQDFIQGFIDGIKAGAQKIWDAVVEFGKNIIARFNESIGVQSPSWIAYESAGDFLRGFVYGIADGIKMVLSALGKLGKAIIDYFKTLDFSGLTNSFNTEFVKVKDFVSNFDWSKLIALIPIGISIVGVKKAFDLISAFGDGIKGINDVLEGFELIEKNFAKVLKAHAANIRADTIKKIATSILILVGAIVLLSYAKPEQMWDAVAIVLVLVAALGVLTWALSKMNDSSVSIGRDGINFSGIKSSLIGIGIAILLLGATAKLISTIDPVEAEAAFKQLVKIMLALVAAVAVYGLFVKGESGKHIHKVGKMMTKLAIALGLMVGVCKLVSMLSPEELQNGIDFITHFVGLAAILGIIGGLGGKSVGKIGGLMLKISIAMILMIGVIKLTKLLKEEDLIPAIIFAGAFVGFIALLVAATTIGSNQQIAKLGGLLLSVSVAMMLMVGVCKLAGTLTPNGLLNGALIAVGVVALVAALVAITKIGNEEQLAKVTGTIVAMTIAIGLLAGISVLLGMVPLEMLVKGVLVVGVIGAIMAGMLLASKGAAQCVGGIVALVVAIGILAGVMIALTLIPDQMKLLNSTIAIVAVLGMLAIVLKVAGGMQPITGKAILSMAALVLVIGALGAVLYLLSGVDPSQSIGIVGTIAVFFGVLLGALYLMNLLSVPSFAALGALAIVTLVVGALGGVLYLLREVDPSQALGIVKAIGIFLAAMMVVCLAASLLGPVAGPAALGLAVLVGFIGALGLVVIGLAALAMDVIAGLPKLGQDLTDFMTNVQGFIDGVNKIPDNISDKIGKLSGAILKLTGAEFVKNIADFLSGGSNIADLGAELKSFGDDINSFATNAKKIDSAVTSLSKLSDVTEIIEGIDVAGLSGFGESLGAEITSMVDSIVEAVNSRNVEFAEAGKKSIEAFSKGVESAQSMATNTVRMVTTKAATYVRASYQTFYSAGSYLVDGIAAGISDNSYKAEAKAAAMAKAAAEAAKEALDINSPSKVFKAIGTSIPEGFANGIDKLRSVVIASATDMANAPLDSVREAIVGISAAINSDMDAQPTIRPVMDLSNVRTGAAAISGLFGSPVGTLATAGSINTMMNRRIQNGADSEVVSAIDKLRKDIRDNTGTTYSINGLTYSGDADLDNAFRTIVRAAKIEGRV